MQASLPALRSPGVLACICLSIFVSGCAAKAPPDPNDPKAVGILQPEVLQRNLKWASEMVNDRVANGEITDEQGQQYLAKYANELTEDVDFSQMKPSMAWKYGEIFRTAQRWDLAKKAEEMAVGQAKKSKNEDRRVNDSLRLAQALGHLGEREEAIKVARSVFDTPENQKAPILMGILYEIVPALRGHGLDVEVAKLLEEAIDQHLKVQVNPETQEGRVFLAVKWHHIQKAWETVVDLYRAASREDLATQARQKSLAMMDRQGRV